MKKSKKIKIGIKIIIKRKSIEIIFTLKFKVLAKNSKKVEVCTFTI
jgi:hypothetical protein